MGSVLKVSRLQKRGQVTIPIEIRRRLGLAEGDMVAFIETEAGIVISPQEMLPAETLDQMASHLQARGVAKRTAGIFQRPGQKPADFKAQRHEFIEGTARKVRAKIKQNAE